MKKLNVRNVPVLLGILFSLTPFIFTDATYAQPAPTTGTETYKFTCAKKLSEPNEPGAVPGRPFPIGDQIWPGTIHNINEFLKGFCSKLDKQATTSELGQRCDPISLKKMMDDKKEIIPTNETPKNCSIKVDASWCDCKPLPKLPPASGSNSKVEVGLENGDSVELSLDEMIGIFESL